MATYDNEQPISLVASADLSTKRNCFVKAHTVAGQMALCGLGENGIGVLTDKPVANQAGRVVTSGKAVVKAGGAFNPGDKIMSDANGQAVVAVAAAARHVLGVAVTAGVSGSMAEVNLQQMGILA